MKKLSITALCMVLGIIMADAQARLSILGDSYSTYGGHVSPAWNWCWYNGSDSGESPNDVTAVEQTWWHILADETGMAIERNNSFSGSTVCCTGYGQQDFSDRAFISRVNDLGNPDIIVVLSGTNDCWAKSPIGEYKYAGWTKHDLYSFRPAFAYMIDRLKSLYPEARIINVVNSELSDDITESQATICGHYNVTNILLTDIDKQSGHPSVKGMRAIADQIKPYVMQ